MCSGIFRHCHHPCLTGKPSKWKVRVWVRGLSLGVPWALQDTVFTLGCFPQRGSWARPRALGHQNHMCKWIREAKLFRSGLALSSVELDKALALPWRRDRTIIR